MASVLQQPQRWIIIGCGYVAQHLLAQHSVSQQSYYSQHQASLALPHRRFEFDLDQPDSWHNFPTSSMPMLFSIPPGYREPEQEAARLASWGQWMQQHRPQLTQLIYLSTTGVYGAAGQFDESSHCQPADIRGQLRLTSEQTLADYFQLSVIRCAGIYGPGQNLAQRLLTGQPVFAGNKPVYRIAVDDLVAIIQRIAAIEQWPQVINAVDQQALSQDQLLKSLLQSVTWQQGDWPAVVYRAKRLDQAAATAGRKIVSTELLTQLNYRLQYPDSRQALVQFLQAMGANDVR